jgi:methyl-accepting chemotaxis protein
MRAGCEMREKPGSAEKFSVKLQAQDTGIVVVAVQVPIFVKGHRYGAASCSWNVANAAGDPRPLRHTGH